MRKRAYMSPERLRAYQTDRLKAVVRYAYENSRFYNSRFKEAGVRPEEIKNVEDLNRLPLLRKEELRENVEQVVSNEFQISRLKVMRTSGSTGRPLSVYLTGRENEFRKAKHIRSNTAYGQRPWDKWVTITSPLHFAETGSLQRLLRVYSVTPVSVFDDVANQFLKIEKLRPDVVDGYSNSILLLAKEAKKKGMGMIRPRFLVGGAELIEPGSRKFVEDVFEAPFYDQYACVELERMAWQCEEKAEYHIDADSLVMQFVDE